MYVSYLSRIWICLISSKSCFSHPLTNASRICKKRCARSVMNCAACSVRCGGLQPTGLTGVRLKVHSFPVKYQAVWINIYTSYSLLVLFPLKKKKNMHPAVINTFQETLVLDHLFVFVERYSNLCWSNIPLFQLRDHPKHTSKDKHLLLWNLSVMNSRSWHKRWKRETWSNLNSWGKTAITGARAYSTKCKMIKTIL